MHGISESAYLSLMIALMGWNMSLDQQALQTDICNTLLKLDILTNNMQKFVHFWLTYEM